MEIHEMIETNGISDRPENCDDKVPVPIDYEVKLQKSLDIIKKSLEIYRPKEIFLSFNGGKDCTVLLDLIVKVLQERDPESTHRLLCIYVQGKHPFDEVEEFVRQCETEYHIHIERARGAVKEVMKNICSLNHHLKACLMGCRRTDPYCDKLNIFQKTDPSWPELMRINPLLDWNCDDIWKYLHTNNVKYCSLYEIGYTSLGDQNNTIPNPHLKYIDEKSRREMYRPAYTLRNADQLERAGRL